jgi:hypothetical protein
LARNCSKNVCNLNGRSKVQEFVPRRSKWCDLELGEINLGTVGGRPTRWPCDCRENKFVKTWAKNSWRWVGCAISCAISFSTDGGPKFTCQFKVRSWNSPDTNQQLDAYCTLARQSCFWIRANFRPIEERRK